MSSPTGDERDDRDLIAAHVDGDPDAYAELVRRHRDRLWAVALRTMGNREDAADGLQDGLVAGFRRAGSYRGEAAVSTWLHRVVVNACLDRLRAAKVRRAEPLPDDLDGVGDRGSLAAATPDADPAEAAARAERRRTVLAALATLPVDQRAALVLVDMEGYPVGEAAAILGCPAGTVKSRCSRGRARLATVLAPLLEGAGEPPHSGPGNPRPARSVETPDAPRGPPA